MCRERLGAHGCYMAWHGNIEWAVVVVKARVHGGGMGITRRLHVTLVGRNGLWLLNAHIPEIIIRENNVEMYAL